MIFERFSMDYEYEIFYNLCYLSASMLSYLLKLLLSVMPAVRCLIAAREAPRRCAMKWGFLSLVRCPWIRSCARPLRKGGHALLIRNAVPVHRLFRTL